MPPKRKMLRFHCHCRAKTCTSSACDTNPSVVLQPLMRDVSSQKKYRFTALPASASLYNKPDSSDILLRVGEHTYFAHRNLLSAASDIFATMLSDNWAESKANELMLQEEPDCIKVFERFLYFIYSGNVVLSESYVVPLFMLADKYNVKSLYDECIKVIEKALKVFIVPEYRIDCNRTSYERHFTTAHVASSSSSSDSSDSSDFFGYDDSIAAAAAAAPSTASVTVHEDSVEPYNLSNATHRFTPSDSNKTKMVASETFPVSLVLKMLNYCNNVRVQQAALFNLEARVGNQICQGNYSAIWNDLPSDLIVKILSDNRFSYPEYSLFEATKVWLTTRSGRESLTIIDAVLVQIRFPLLSTVELYSVMNEEIVKKSPKVKKLVEEAIKFKLFYDCCSAEDKEKWSGCQFEPRRPLQ